MLKDPINWLVVGMGSKFRTSNAFGTPPMDTILVCTIFVYPHITLQEIAATTISDRFWLNACLLTLTIHHFDFRRQLADRFITVFMPSARHASRADHTTWSVLCHKTTGHHPILITFCRDFILNCWICWLSSFGCQFGHISHSHFSECNLHPLIPADIADIVQACSEDLRSVISRFLIKARFQEAFAETCAQRSVEIYPEIAMGRMRKSGWIWLRREPFLWGEVEMGIGGNPILQVGLNSRCNESACGLCSLSWVPFRVSTSARASFHRLLGLVG